MPITEDPDLKTALLDHAVGIVCAFVSHNAVPVAEVPGLIGRTYDALRNLTLPQQPAEDAKAGPAPAVPVDKSIKHEHLVSLIDGKPYKMLRRHIAKHGYTPDTYRKAFGLPSDYPMASAAHSRHRSAIAKQMGLGSQRKKAIAAAPARKPAKAAA